MKTLFIILFFSSPLFAQKIEPGEWKSRTKFRLNGLPLPSQNETNCITKDELKNPKETIEEALKRNKCKLIKWTLKKDQVNARIKCDNDDFDAEGTITGTFSKKSYDLKGEATGDHHIIGESRAQIELSGEWLGTCGAEIKKKSL